eukprot:5905581-Prymnesium_polylepis.1
MSAMLVVPCLSCRVLQHKQIVRMGQMSHRSKKGSICDCFAFLPKRIFLRTQPAAGGGKSSPPRHNIMQPVQEDIMALLEHHGLVDDDAARAL